MSVPGAAGLAGFAGVPPETGLAGSAGVPPETGLPGLAGEPGLDVENEAASAAAGATLRTEMAGATQAAAPTTAPARNAWRREMFSMMSLFESIFPHGRYSSEEVHAHLA